MSADNQLHKVAVLIPVDLAEEGDQVWLDVAGSVLARRFGQAQGGVVGANFDRATGEMTTATFMLMSETPDISATDRSIVLKLGELLQAGLMREGLAVSFDDELIAF